MITKWLISACLICLLFSVIYWFIIVFPTESGDSSQSVVIHCSNVTPIVIVIKKKVKDVDTPKYNTVQYEQINLMD